MSSLGEAIQPSYVFVGATVLHCGAAVSHFFFLIIFLHILSAYTFFRNYFHKSTCTVVDFIDLTPLNCSNICAGLQVQHAVHIRVAMSLKRCNKILLRCYREGVEKGNAGKAT